MPQFRFIGLEEIRTLVQAVQELRRRFRASDFKVTITSTGRRLTVDIDIIYENEEFRALPQVEVRQVAQLLTQSGYPKWGIKVSEDRLYVTID